MLIKSAQTIEVAPRLLVRGKGLAKRLALTGFFKQVKLQLDGDPGAKLVGLKFFNDMGEDLAGV